MANCLILLCSLLIISQYASAQSSEYYELDIIHFNDFHAHFDEISPSGSVCDPAADPCIGGYARLYTAISEARELAPQALVLNGGDTFQGTVWFNFLSWNVSQHFMNLIPHDAHVLGNHEFDHGIAGLVPYLQHLNAPMLGANVNATLEPEVQALLKNHIIVEKKGRKIGIIGILLRVFSAPMGGVTMDDEMTAVNREAAILKEQGVDIIIVLSHCGYDSDRFMAANVVSDVDIIVGAHSHSLLYTGTPPNNDFALGDYPTVITQAGGHRVLVVQASAYTRYLGNIKLFIDDAGIIQRWSGQPVFLGTSIIQDPQILRELEPWREIVDAIGKEVLGQSRVTLNRSWCRSRECNMGSWACDGLIHQVKELSKGEDWGKVHVCLINSGGLRIQINPGVVTTESLLMALPFENDVQTYDLLGEYLLEALEFSVSGTVTPGDFGTGRMVQIGGLRVVYNVSEPSGSRVVSARVRCVDCDVPRYEPLQLDTVYRLVTQHYIGDGGGGFTMLAENRENLHVLEERDFELLQNYMRYQGTVLQDLDGRIQVTE